MAKENGNAWSHLDDLDDVEILQVPGGYLYRVTARHYDMFTITFVPDMERIANKVVKVLEDRS